MTHDIYYDKGFHLFPKWWNIWSCKISSWVQRKKFKMSFCSPLTQRWDLFKHRTENLLRLLGDPFCANFSSHLLLAREVDEGWGVRGLALFYVLIFPSSDISHKLHPSWLPRSASSPRSIPAKKGKKRETWIIGGGSGWLGGTQADTWLLMTLPPPPIIPMSDILQTIPCSLLHIYRYRLLLRRAVDQEI